MIQNATINVSVSNHYRNPSYASEVISQGLLGERVEILEEKEKFARIRQEDNYESWISSDQVYRGDQPVGRTVLVRDHFLRIYREPDSSSEGIKDAVFGTSLMSISEIDSWYEIVLPDGLCGWAKKCHFGTFPDFSAVNVINLAREFLGYQYVWGGRSPKGFDCSGYVQTVFGMLGIRLPRDSWQQQKHNLVALNWQDAQPADLLFFGKTPERVTHVGIAIGGDRFIHASGWVKYNSMCEDDKDFSPHHLQTFISVNRYRPEEKR